MATWADINAWVASAVSDPYSNVRVRENKSWNPTTYKEEPVFAKNIGGDFSDVGSDWNVQYYTGAGVDPKWLNAGTWADFSSYAPPPTEAPITEPVVPVEPVIPTEPEPVVPGGGDPVVEAGESATVPFDPNAFDWFADAVEAFTTGTQDLIDAWQTKYAHFGTDLEGLQAQMPEFKGVDYADIDRLLETIETGPTEADRGAAREEVAKNFGYNTWAEFQTQLGGWESSTVDARKAEEDAARQMGYGSWDEYQTALAGMGYTELTPEGIREQAAKDMGFDSWAAYQAELSATYTPQTDVEINDAAAQAMGFDTWAEYKAALDAAGGYTYATDVELRERTAKDLGFNTWDEFQTRQQALQATALSDPDADRAATETAKGLGFDTADELKAEIERLRGAIESGDVAGLTSEERDVYERQRSQAVRQVERRANDQMEAVLGNTGSMTQYLAAADEANSRIVDTNLQYEMAQMNQNMAMQTETLNRMMSIYTGLFEGQEQGFGRSMDRQLQQLQIANQQFLTYLQQSAASIQGYGQQDIAKAGLAEQRYGTLQGTMAAQQGRLAGEDLAREGMAADRYNTLLTSGGDRIGTLTQAELTRTGQADARAANLRSDYTGAYGTIMQAEIERVRGDTTKFIELVKAGNAGVQDILNMKQNGVMAALTGYMERANLEIYEYGEEVDGIVAQADMIYKGAMMELGMDQGIFDILESEYNIRMKPIIDMISIQMQEQAYDMAPWQLVVDGLSAIGDIIPDSLSIF
jgi:hypothetical protein